MGGIRNVCEFLLKNSETGDDTNSFNTDYDRYSTYQSDGTTLD